MGQEGIPRVADVGPGGRRVGGKEAAVVPDPSAVNGRGFGRVGTLAAPGPERVREGFEFPSATRFDDVVCVPFQLLELQALEVLALRACEMPDALAPPRKAEVLMSVLYRLCDP